MNNAEYLFFTFNLKFEIFMVLNVFLRAKSLVSLISDSFDLINSGIFLILPSLNGFIISYISELSSEKYFKMFNFRGRMCSKVEFDFG